MLPRRETRSRPRTARSVRHSGAAAAASISASVSLPVAYQRAFSSGCAVSTICFGLPKRRLARVVFLLPRAASNF